MNVPPEVVEVLRKWVRKAEHDLEAASRIMAVEEGSPFDTVCFHCQQAAGKYLKCLLTCSGIQAPGPATSRNRALWASSDFKNSLKSRGIRVVGIKNLSRQFQRCQSLFHRTGLPVCSCVGRCFRSHHRDYGTVHPNLVDQRHRPISAEFDRLSCSMSLCVPVYPKTGRDFPFTCNICGQPGLFQQIHYFNPETPSCAECRSNVRLRWLVHKLSIELFGRSMPLSEFPSKKSITGLGLTDPEPLATEMAARFNYRNTYLTSEPQFDIRFDPSPLGDLDFLIASEVFEHVEPPVSHAFQNAARLLKNSGILLLTTPWVWEGDPATAIPQLYDWRLEKDGDDWTIFNRRADDRIERFSKMSFDGSPGPSLGYTREHFPALSNWKLSNDDGQWKLINKSPDNKEETFRHLVFHEGPGLALEMRLFTKSGIEENLLAAGFTQIDFEIDDTPESGIVFGYPWSRPVLARKG
jgi:SAM-dependent methyltransferase